jgi:hypothetical protein
MKSGRSRHGCLHCYQRHQGQGEAKEESGHGFRGVVGGGWMQVVLPLLAARHGAPSPFLLLFPLTLSLGCPGRRTPVYHEKGQRDVSITDVVRPRRYSSQEMHPLERRKKMMVTSDAATPPPSFNFLLVAWSLFAVVGAVPHRRQHRESARPTPGRRKCARWTYARASPKPQRNFSCPLAPRRFFPQVDEIRQKQGTRGFHRPKSLPLYISFLGIWPRCTTTWLLHDFWCLLRCGKCYLASKKGCGVIAGIVRWGG